MLQHWVKTSHSWQYIYSTPHLSADTSWLDMVSIDTVDDKCGAYHVTMGQIHSSTMPILTLDNFID